MMIKKMKPTSARRILGSAVGHILATMMMSGTLKMWLAAQCLSRELLKDMTTMMRLVKTMNPPIVVAVIKSSASGVGQKKTHSPGDHRRLSAAASPT